MSKEDRDEKRLRKLRDALPKPGLYQLNREVANPRPDKRRRYAWDAEATFPEGLTLAITVRDLSGDLYRRTYHTEGGEIDIVDSTRKRNPHAYTAAIIQPPGSGRYSERLTVGWFASDGLDREMQIAEALAPHLEPVEETVGYVLRETGMDGWRTTAVLQVLVDAGMITPTDLRKAYERDRESEDGES